MVDNYFGWFVALLADEGASVAQQRCQAVLAVIAEGRTVNELPAGGVSWPRFAASDDPMRVVALRGCAIGHLSVSTRRMRFTNRDAPLPISRLASLAYVVPFVGGHEGNTPR